MNYNTKNTFDDLQQIIFDPVRSASRERESIKAKLLADYLRPPIYTGPGFSDSFIASIRPRPLPNDPGVFWDEDGDLALAQPYAEMFLLSGARSFNAALGLIVMMETCYEPTVGDPSALQTQLRKFHPLVKDGEFLSLVKLYEFLEVEEDIYDWFSASRLRHRLVDGRDYLLQPADDLRDSKLGMRDVTRVHLDPFVASRLAVATPSIRGRKLRACLVSPRVNSIDLAELDPTLLELMLTPPAREP